MLHVPPKYHNYKRLPYIKKKKKVNHTTPVNEAVKTPIPNTQHRLRSPSKACTTASRSSSSAHDGATSGGHGGRGPDRASRDGAWRSVCSSAAPATRGSSCSCTAGPSRRSRFPPRWGLRAYVSSHGVCCRGRGRGRACCCCCDGCASGATPTACETARGSCAATTCGGDCAMALSTRRSSWTRAGASPSRGLTARGSRGGSQTGGANSLLLCAWGHHLRARPRSRRIGPEMDRWSTVSAAARVLGRDGRANPVVPGARSRCRRGRTRYSMNRRSPGRRRGRYRRRFVCVFGPR
ncbi:hypothetical protein F5X98DRAFT_390238 [Xylaria grammica]|nr:hypothetical protein F5X98DRAFT_390238 [Xylaria grammica]